MIIGRVTRSRDVGIQIGVVDARGRALRLRAVVDTGFTGYLTLPERTIRRLAARRIATSFATLGDGSEVRFGVYEVTVLWDGEARRIEAAAAEVAPLVGMSLLDGFRVEFDAVIGGEVLIRPRARRKARRRSMG